MKMSGGLDNGYVYQPVRYTGRTTEKIVIFVDGGAGGRGSTQKLGGLENHQSHFICYLIFASFIIFYILNF